MNRHAPTISTQIVRHIRDCLELAGAPSAQLLASQGIDPAQIDDREKSVALVDYVRFFESAAEVAGNPHFGLHAARLMSADGLGPLSFLFLSAPTLGQAFQTFSKYLDAMQEATYNAFSIEGSVCHFTYAIRDADVTERRQDSEYSIGVMCNLVRQYLGRRSPPQEVHFEHQRLGALSTFENYFDCPVFFEQPQNRLVLPSEWLNRGSSAMSSELFPIIATHLKARMHGETLHTCTATKVRDVLMASPPDDLPALETVAMGLDCSRATLMRKLAREGTHFSELAAERRLDFARQLLRSGTRSIADIALASGYAETASFTRAFKRRFGQLPSHCRRAA